MLRNMAKIPNLASTRIFFPIYINLNVRHFYRFRVVIAIVSASNFLKCVLASGSFLAAMDAVSRTISTAQWVVP